MNETEIQATIKAVREFLEGVPPGQRVQFKNLPFTESLNNRKSYFLPLPNLLSLYCGQLPCERTQVFGSGQARLGFPEDAFLAFKCR